MSENNNIPFDAESTRETEMGVREDIPVQPQMTPPRDTPQPKAIDISKLLRSIEQALQTLDYSNSNLFSRVSANIQDIDAALQGITSYQAENAKRTRRFEEGYDFQILKNFSKQIVREIYTLENQLSKVNDAGKKELIQDTIDGLVELLDRNSIVQIDPEIGSLYAGQERNVECAPVKIFSEDDALNGRIASVVHRGFLYEFNDGSSRVLAPAKVVLFSNVMEQCSEITAQTLALSKSVKKKIKVLTTIFRKPGFYDDEQTPQVLWPIDKDKCLYMAVILLSVLSIFLGWIIYRQNSTINALLCSLKEEKCAMNTKEPYEIEPASVSPYKGKMEKQQKSPTAVVTERKEPAQSHVQSPSDTQRKASSSDSLKKTKNK